MLLGRKMKKSLFFLVGLVVGRHNSAHPVGPNLGEGRKVLGRWHWPQDRPQGSLKGLAPAEGADAFRWPKDRGLPQVRINMHFLHVA